jgi:hypothetical protein
MDDLASTDIHEAERLQARKGEGPRARRVVPGERSRGYRTFVFVGVYLRGMKMVPGGWMLNFRE